jgi:hypothetical protein
MYKLVKQYVENGGNVKRLTARLNKSERTVYRYIKGYKEHGKAFFVHGNTGRKPVTTILDEIKKHIIEIYNSSLYDTNFTHFYEILQEEYPQYAHISLSTIRNIFKKEDLPSPKARHSTLKALRRKLKLQEKEGVADIPDMLIEEPIESTCPHPRRERSKYAGELLYMDASIHPWFGPNYEKTALHASIDDSTGTLTGLYMDTQETLKGYYHSFAYTLANFGIPVTIQTDGRTVFEYKRAGVRSTENDTPTQFTYACKQLGTEVAAGHSAQEQGKVERLFQTLQSRLPVEFRRRGITDIETANEFLTKEFIPYFNAKFARSFNDTTSVFEGPMEPADINLALSVLSERTVDHGHCISYQNEYYKFLKTNGEQAVLKPTQKVLVIKALDGTLYASCKEVLYVLKKVPHNTAYSKNFDYLEEKPKPRRQYIPDMRHPWKHNVFIDYEVHRLRYVYSFDEACYTQDKFMV